MVQRKTEACIFLLVVIRSSYSLEEKQCSNAYTSCAQSQGVCKPECKMDEERLGSCHGASCSCCKRNQPGGVLELDDTLTNEISSYDNYDFWLRRGGREYLRGKGRRDEKYGRSKGTGDGCEYEGNLYADGAEWTVDCMDHTCDGEHISSKLSPSCCDYDDHKYCDGDTWSKFCTVFTCNHGTVDTKEDENCCEDDGKKYLSGDSWTEACYEIVCHMGVIEEIQLPSCCEVNEVLNETGRLGSEVNKVLYESGQTWTEACDHFKCNNGMIERSDILTCCPGDPMKRSGETWIEGCIRKTCVEGTINDEMAIDICCVVDDSTTYKESETVIKIECQVWECKCTDIECSLVFIDGSQCDPKPIYENETTTENPGLNDPPLPDIPVRCRYNNTWMEDGEMITEECFEITCRGGCACWEELEGGCCYNNETEHKNEGETWEENCTVYTCADEDITEKESLRSECTPKEEGCMYGEKEYLDGDTINYGCTIHQCKSGIFISFPDPTCCVVDGSAYSSGSKWEEECYTSFCDMGMVKKTERPVKCNTNNCQGGNCNNNCPSGNGCQGNGLFQLQQPQQRCQYCCMVGNAVVQNGHTWMDNCNSNSCNQGTISSIVMPNCG